MGATVHIQRNFGNLEDLPIVTVDEMRELGLLMRERIVLRTISGIDANNAPFAPYSPEYFALKSKELGIAVPVNLQVSGNMLNHLQIVALDDHTVTLGWVQ